MLLWVSKANEIPISSPGNYVTESTSTKLSNSRRPRSKAQVFRSRFIFGTGLLAVIRRSHLSHWQTVERSRVILSLLPMASTYVSSAVRRAQYLMFRLVCSAEDHLAGEHLPRAFGHGGFSTYHPSGQNQSESSHTPPRGENRAASALGWRVSPNDHLPVSVSQPPTLRIWRALY